MRLRTSWTTALLVAVALAMFVSLGRWQWERGMARRVQWAEFAQAGEALPVETHDLDALPRFERVTLSGRYDAARQFVLDNRSRDGRPGYEVLTPFVLADGRALLVNRGWLPFSGYRDRLPEVSFTPAARETVTGRLDRLPVAGLPAGRAAPAQDERWPKVVSFPRMDELARALGRPLEARVVLLDAAAPHGYARDWRPPGVAPGRHFAYAVQWWAFAALAVIVWLVLSLKRKRQ